jgi:6-phosphogluconate dehydrogenase
MSNEELAKTFAEWNKGDLDSYLIEITSHIFTKKDDIHPDKYLIDMILDAAGQKGTGKWTVESALDTGMPVTLIAEAVFARCLSSMKVGFHFSLK